MWHKLEKDKFVGAFQLENEPELIYIIKIRNDEYMVVHEDGYDLDTGWTEWPLNAERIKSKYGIDL